MPKLIVCLGYKLNEDNSIPAVLENRLKDVVRLCDENANSTLFLTGSARYGDLREGKISEAGAMKKYLEKNFSGKLAGAKVIIEESTKSAVEQICYLKKFMEAEKIKPSELVIVSSQFFSERVKLYAEYIFGTTDGVVFIASPLPPEIMGEFEKAEEYKLKEGIGWLSRYKKGDDQTILKEQREFQAGVIKGKIKQPPIS